MAILQSPEIHHRNDFPLLCMWRKYSSVVEVGVDLGHWSQVWFDRWWLPGNFTGVDNFQPYEGNPWDRESDYYMTLMRYAHMARLLRMDSVTAAKSFLDSKFCSSVDFVYIDGDHSYESVVRDLEAWWPVVSPNGIIAGHDFDDTHPGVIQAVTEFSEKVGQDVYLTFDPNEGTCPSWYIYKSGMPGPEWTRWPVEDSKPTD